MKKVSFMVLAAAAMLAAGVAGAAEPAAGSTAAKPQNSQSQTQSKAEQTCKDQGKTGKELKACIREERKKEHEAMRQQNANKQHAKATDTEAQPAAK